MLIANSPESGCNIGLLFYYRDVVADAVVQSRPVQQIEEEFHKAYGSLLFNRQHGLAITINRLTDLLEPESEEDDEIPSRDAVTKTKALFERTYAQMSDYFFPRGWVTSPPGGSVRVEWSNGNRHVRLFVSGNTDNPGYIYRQEMAQWNQSEVTPETLADALSWLLKAQNA